MAFLKDVLQQELIQKITKTSDTQSNVQERSSPGSLPYTSSELLHPRAQQSPRPSTVACHLHSLSWGYARDGHREGINSAIHHAGVLEFFFFFKLSLKYLTIHLKPPREK